MSHKEDREAWTKHVEGRQKAASMPQAKRSKYGAVRSRVGDKTFHSAKEAKRYLELAMLQAAQQIGDLKLQPEFKMFIGEVNVGSYFADFSYIDRDGRMVIEDVKSQATKTAVYRLKRKIVEAIYNIEIREV